jgi:hypothetical protein
MPNLLPAAQEYAEADESFFGESYASETDHGDSENEQQESPNYLFGGTLLN